MACSTKDPLRALEALRRGLVIAQESGNRANVSYLSMAMVMTFFRTETQPSDKLTALDNIKLAILQLL